MKTTSKELTRRRFVGTVASAVAFPYIIPASALGMEDRPSPSNRITLGCIGMGNRGNADMNAAMGFSEIQVVAICDVGASKCEAAKARVDGKYDNKDCAAYSDFREITRCGDIDAVLIATPDHWHAVISIDAMRNGKDVFCEKPETLTIREGRIMVETVHRYARVFSGGSQRVWGDYNWLHKMVCDEIIDYLFYIEDNWQPFVDRLPVFIVVLLDRFVRVLIIFFLCYRK